VFSAFAFICNQSQKQNPSQPPFLKGRSFFNFYEVKNAPSLEKGGFGEDFAFDFFVGKVILNE
jgi:hypothetical protein